MTALAVQKKTYVGGGREKEEFYSFIGHVDGPKIYCCSFFFFLAVDVRTCASEVYTWHAHTHVPHRKEEVIS